MKIIGTGLSGLVGSRIVELLPQHQFIDLSLDQGFDILKPTTLEPAFIQNPDITTVIHLAAYTDNQTAWDQRGDKDSLCYQLNVVGTQNIINVCQKYHLRLIFISTDFVFDGTKKSDYTETDTPKPIEWYGQTKFEAEKIIASNLNNYAIARIAFPYRNFYAAKKDLVHKMIANFQAEKNSSYFIDQIITPTFIDDLAPAMDFLLKLQTSEIFHLVGSISLSPYDLAIKVAEVFKYNLKLVQPSTLAEYIKSMPPGSRPYQSRLALSNQKITEYGLNFCDIDTGLGKLKSQL